MPNQSQENPVLALGPNSIGQVLYFFGARHTNDPADAQFKHLKEFFTEFLNVGKGERIVFIEGATREMPQNYEEAIRQYGEAGAVKWLASNVSVDVIHSEPSEKEQRKLLCSSFDPQIVAYTVIAQNLGGWFQQTGQTSFDEAVTRVLNRETKFSDIYGFVPDRLWLGEQHKKLFSNQQLEDKSFLDSISDPRKNDTVINNVVASRSGMRDKHLLKIITEARKSEKSIFVVYGKGHLATLEQPLRKLFQ